MRLSLPLRALLSLSLSPVFVFRTTETISLAFSALSFICAERGWGRELGLPEIWTEGILCCGQGGNRQQEGEERERVGGKEC